MSVADRVRQFDFYRDTFAFANELHWQYLVDEKTGRVTTRKNDPPPNYAHRCFVVVRSARQFFLHARFDPAKEPLTENDYCQRIREVVQRCPWEESAEAGRIEFPGFSSLREFSGAHEAALKASCGGAWQSYVNRRHWRMLVPFWRAHQEKEAAQLEAAVHRSWPPIVHVVRFPTLTINHALLIFGAQRTADGIDFAIYDPNLPAAPSLLQFSARDGRFVLPRTIYWAGGRVDVYETYRGGMF